MKTVKDIDGEIAKLQQTASSIASDKSKGEQKLLEVKAARDELRLSALTGDGEAREKLDRAYGEQRKIELQIEDAAGALNQVSKQVAALQLERDDAFRREKMAEFEKVSVEALDTARFIATCLPSV